MTLKQLQSSSTAPDGSRYSSIVSVPGWVNVQSGVTPLLDIDYMSNRAYGANATPSTASAFMTTSRGSTTDMIDDSLGNWTSVGANTLRRSEKGALIEEARTNSIRNNSMQGPPVTGTPGTPPTNWQMTSGSNVSLQIVSFGTNAQGIDFIRVRIFGTPNATSTCNIYFETATNIAASNGQVWAASMFLGYPDKTAIPANAIAIGYDERTAAGAFVTQNGVSLANGSSTMTRQSVSGTLNGGVTTAFVRPLLYMNFTNAVPVDYTIDIGWPQMENCGTSGVYATSPIRTTTTALGRSADLSSRLITATSLGTIYVEYTIPSDSSFSIFPGAVCLHDGTSNNAIKFYTRSIDDTNHYGAVTGGISQVDINTAGTYTYGNVNKAAGTFALNDYAFSMNGSAVVTDTVATVPVYDRFNIGILAPTNNFLNGYVRRLTIWPTRLPNATLQAITT